MDAPLVFLHVSDIHLNEDELISHVDLDHDLRTELVHDLRRLRGDAFQSLTGVFVTGDIASAGKQSEFESARHWLEELRQEFDFAEGSTWCVPGNHDVDRSRITRSKLSQSLRDHVREGRESDAAERLRGYLGDPEAHGPLLSPLQEYNLSFANRFKCTTECPELSWADTIDDSSELLRSAASLEGYSLQIVGLNSAVVSDSKDNGRDGRLVLGLRQLQSLTRRPRTFCISLCHHPPSWLFDREQAEAFLNSRTTLQLFGHDHESGILRINDSLRIHAGALHPNRREPAWQPHFNVISLRVHRQTGVPAALQVRVWPRVWDAGATSFRPAASDDSVQYEEYLLPLHSPMAPPAERTDQGNCDAATAVPMPRRTACESEPVREGSPMPRDTAYRFFELSWLQRIRIALELDLYADEDADVDETEMGRRVFERASQRGLMDKLEAAIDKAGLREQRV